MIVTLDQLATEDAKRASQRSYEKRSRAAKKSPAALAASR